MYSTVISTVPEHVTLEDSEEGHLLPNKSGKGKRFRVGALVAATVTLCFVLGVSVTAPTRASPAALNFNPRAVTCQNYESFTSNLNVIRCQGKQECKEEGTISLNAGNSDSGKILICDGEQACADTTFLITVGPAVPVAVVCCQKGACEGNFNFRVARSGVTSHVHCEGKDACKGEDNVVMEVYDGSTLNVYCADTEDTCEGATFIGSPGSVACSGDGCLNALTDVPRGDDDGGGGPGNNDGGGGGGGSSETRPTRPRRSQPPPPRWRSTRSRPSPLRQSPPYLPPPSPPTQKYIFSLIKRQARILKTRF